MMPVDRQLLLKQLAGILGPEGLLTDAAARRVYALDSSHLELGRPLAVALPATADEVARVVELCAAHGLPVVCRGSGTGLSGGAVPPEGALVLGTGRLKKAGRSDPEHRAIEVEPGILNEEVTRLVASRGLHFAPDPSSQSAASIGGNIAENAGGPHCLRYGVTLQHLRRLDWVDARGRRLTTGGGLPVERGLDLTSLLCGSEGTLGVVTGARLNLVPDPPTVVTLLAVFPDLNDATEAVVRLLTGGLLPVALEMVDQAMLGAVEEAFAFGFPTDVEGAMIAELAGSEAEVREDAARARELLMAGGARELTEAWSREERLELWKCRKKAFGAVGRLAPRYVTMDVVVPLGQLPPLVRRIQDIKREYGVEVATAFHAGDGNLHPGVHYDDREPDNERRAHAAADAIIRAALDMEGSATGEHGVGIEKLHVLPWQWNAELARLSFGLKQAFDPDGLMNPGKLLPDPDAHYAPIKPLPEELLFRWDSLTVTAPAKTELAALQAAALARGLTLPVGTFRQAEPGTLGLGAATTVGDLVAGLVPGPGLLAQGTARDYLLELWARTGDGRLFHTGAPVFKNVAGYGLGPALCGAGRVYAEPLAATFQLKPISESVLQLTAQGPGLDLSGCARLLSALPRHDGSPVTLLFDAPGARLILWQGGRDRPWDLQAAGRRYREILVGAENLDLVIERVSRLPESLAASPLPCWARRSTHWSFHQLVGDQPSSGPPLPESDSWIWQGAPTGFWLSADHPARAGHRADTIFRDGAWTLPPPPAEGVPRDLLARLKTLFDPAGHLPTPPWLAPAEEAGHV